MHDCQTCPRHLTHHPELVKLLDPQAADDLQRRLCDQHEAGSCLGDPFA